MAAIGIDGVPIDSAAHPRVLPTRWLAGALVTR
jgi:hypothetical protein